jgi:hypothetical protein
MSISLSPSTSEHILKIGKWFLTAEVETQKDVPNTSKCTDKDRFSVIKPLLEELGLEVSRMEIWLARESLTPLRNVDLVYCEFRERYLLRK